MKNTEPPLNAREEGEEIVAWMCEKENGKFMYFYEKKLSNLVYINWKDRNINFVFDGHGKTLDFTKRFKSLLEKYIDEFCENVHGEEKKITKSHKNDIEKGVEEYLIHRKKDIPIGVIVNGAILYNEKVYTNTDYEANVFITKNFEDIEKNVEYLIPSDEERIEIKETLKKLFGENFLKFSAFIIHSMMGEEGVKPILFLTGSARIGKTTTGRLIEKIVSGKDLIISPLEFEKILPNVLESRIALIDDISAKEKKGVFFDLLKRVSTSKTILINQRYTKSGVRLPTNTFFICTSTDENLFEFDKQLESRVVKININRNEFAKKNIDKLLKNDEWILKVRGFFYYSLNVILNELNNNDVKNLEIKKRFENYMKILYIIQKKFFYSENDEFSELNTEESEVEIKEKAVKKFLNFILDVKKIERKTGKEIFEEFKDWLEEREPPGTVEMLIKNVPLNVFFRNVKKYFEEEMLEYDGKIIECKKEVINIINEKGKKSTKKCLSFIVKEE